MPVLRAILVILVVTGPVAAQVELRTLDGKTMRGKVVEATAAEVAIEDDGELVRVPLSNVLLLTFSPVHSPLGKYTQVRLVDDTSLLCTKVAFKEKSLNLTLTSGAVVELGHEFVTQIVQEAQDAPLRQKFNDLARQKIKRDRIIALRDGQLNAIEGTFGAIDEAAQKIEFRREGFPPLNIPVDRLHGMIFYRLDASLEQPKCIVYDNQGNSLAATSVLLKDGKYQVVATFGANLVFEVDTLARLDFNMGKLTFLSSLEPRKESTQSTVDRIRRDSTLTKSPTITAPIMLDKEYTKGLTMPPGELEYELQGKYKAFKAIAGVCRNAEDFLPDIERRPILKIFCDGEERFSDVVPSGVYRAINIDVRDVNKLRIVVLPRDPDVPAILAPRGDYLSLAEARVTQ